MGQPLKSDPLLCHFDCSSVLSNQFLYVSCEFTPICVQVHTCIWPYVYLDMCMWTPFVCFRINISPWSQSLQISSSRLDRKPQISCLLSLDGITDTYDWIWLLHGFRVWTQIKFLWKIFYWLRHVPWSPQSHGFSNLSDDMIPNI